MNKVAALTKALTNATTPEAKRTITNMIRVETVRGKVACCVKCDLAGSNTPYSVGQNLILGLTFQPSRADAENGVLLSGKLGAVLDECLKVAGLERPQLTVVPVVACASDRKAVEFQACGGNMAAQLNASNNWVGVVFGLDALKALVEGKTDATVTRVDDWLDKPFWVDGRIWFPTFHPKEVLYDRFKSLEIASSLRAAAAVKYGKTAVNVAPVNAYTRLFNDERLVAHIDKHGWGRVWVESLGDYVLVVVDERTMHKRKGGVPVEYRTAVPYTGVEYHRLKSGTWGAVELARLHMLKQEFAGEVVA